MVIVVIVVIAAPIVARTVVRIAPTVASAPRNVGARRAEMVARTVVESVVANGRRGSIVTSAARVRIAARGMSVVGAPTRREVSDRRATTATDLRRSTAVQSARSIATIPRATGTCAGMGDVAAIASVVVELVQTPVGTCANRGSRANRVSTGLRSRPA